MVIAGSGIVAAWTLPVNRREAEVQLAVFRTELSRQRGAARYCARWARQSPADARMAGQHSRAAGALLWRVRVLEVLCG